MTNYKKYNAYEYCDRIEYCDSHTSRTLEGKTCFHGDCSMSRWFIKRPEWDYNQTKQEVKNGRK